MSTPSENDDSAHAPFVDQTGTQPDHEVREQYGSRSHSGGQQRYGAQPYGQAPATRKDPALMLVASLIVPGLWTILNGETGPGILAGFVVGALLSVSLIGLPIVLGFGAGECTTPTRDPRSTTLVTDCPERDALEPAVAASFP